MNLKKELAALDPVMTNFNAHKVDVLTPHKLVMVLLVQTYLKAKQNCIEEGVTFPAQSRRKFCMLILKLIQYPDMNYQDLHNLLTSTKYKIVPYHLAEFEKCMENLHELGVENLFDILDSQSITDKTFSEHNGISQFGIVGLYIKRVVLAFDRMKFPNIMKLYKSVNTYYQKGIRALALCSNKIIPSSSGNVSMSSTTSSSSIPPMSPTSSSILDKLDIDEMKIGGHDRNEQGEMGDGDQIFEAQMTQRDRNAHGRWSIKQAELFMAQQRCLLETNELKALAPIELQSKLNEITHDNPLFSQTHFLSYLNNLRLRDIFNSIYSLHRSFDRSPVQTFNPVETKGFQYASLNLAILHTHFNHKEEALASLKECIMLAQECGDKNCLELANSWYSILNNENCKPVIKNISDQADGTMIQSFSLNVQFIVKIAALRGYRPSDLFELLLKSDDVNCRNVLMEFLSNTFAERAALWTLYGKNEIASLYSQLLLKLKRSWFLDDIGNGESVCKVLCGLALWFSIQGDINLSNVIIQHARERFRRDPHSRSWMICDCYIIIQQSIYRCKWQEAMKACCQLYIYDENSSILQRATILIAKRNLPVATKVLDKLLSKFDESILKQNSFSSSTSASKNMNDLNELDTLIYIRAKILRAYSLISSDFVAMEVIEILNDISAFAKEKYLEYEVAIIDMIFSYVLLYMNMPQKALQTIKRCMETILTNGGIYDRAKTIFLFAKCLLASTSCPQEKLKRIKDCTEMLNEAIGYFKKLEAHSKVKDVYIFLAKFYNEMEIYPERNRYSCLFRQYHSEFPTSKEYLNVFF